MPGFKNLSLNLYPYPFKYFAMIPQLIFAVLLLITLAIFAFTMIRYFRYFRFTQKRSLKDFPLRVWETLTVGFAQTKIFRHPLMGLLHALVFWGFLMILLGSVEMVADGLAGTERSFRVLGGVYDFFMGTGDVFAAIILLAVLVFLFRRLFLKVRRFYGPEMKPVSKADANLALVFILLLMVSLLGMNTFYLLDAPAHGRELAGVYPVSRMLTGIFEGMEASQLHFWHELNWWLHILLIFGFANVLPYSKHFHVFTSIPNVFVSKVGPLGYADNMESITREVKLMLNDTGDAAAEAEEEIPRFGVGDAQDVDWVNYVNALACTECGRCTAVCPANITGKLLSPRKVMMDLRARMKQKGPGLLKEGAAFDDGLLLAGDHTTAEELWACTMCNACIQECPININQPGLILDMRRFLVLEKAEAPSGLNTAFTNLENNGAPWQYPPDDRMKWAENISLKDGSPAKVPLMSEAVAGGKTPEWLFWVGSAGAFDDRYKKVSREFVKILHHLKTDYAVLGTEESDSGDVARRSGNEMLFQMQAFQNIEVLGSYQVKKIVTCCPHDYNTLKNEYPDFGGKYKVWHHSHFLSQQLQAGNLLKDLNKDIFASERIVFHDPCYLGRANREYDAPREVLKSLGAAITEMERNRSFGLCCGGGGGQMFKEAEKGDKEVYRERTEEAMRTRAGIIATACPFCMTMLTDGIKSLNREEEVKNLDIAELLSQAMGL